MNHEEKSKIDALWDASGLDNSKSGEEAPSPETPGPKEPAPQAEEKKKNPHAEKKKDIRFLVIYTTVFVIVISGLIAGSYMITSRIHKQMAENDRNLDASQSTLTNIQNENTKLREENAALTAQNETLTASQKEAEELIGDIGNMVEQNDLLSAAQSAYIGGNRTRAKELTAAIIREQLSVPNQERYDLLKNKLGI